MITFARSQRFKRPIDYPLSIDTVQRKETTKNASITELSGLPARGRLLAIDPGTKFIGIAVSDEDRIVTRPLRTIKRTSWKDLLLNIKDTVSEFDAVALVIGLPFAFDGGETEMSAEARDMAKKFALSLDVPVFLQDERVTTYDARARLWARNVPAEGTKPLVDAEAAAIILSDFISRVEENAKRTNAERSE